MDRLTKFILFALVFLGVQILEAKTVRLAITPFHAETSSFSVAKLGSEYASIVLTSASEIKGIQIVERNLQSPVWSELALVDGMGTTTSWENAEVIVRGKMRGKSQTEDSITNFNPFFPYVLKLEAVDTKNGDILATLELLEEKLSRNDSLNEELQEQAPKFLQRALERRENLSKMPRYLPMFFRNSSSNTRLRNYE